MTAIRQQVTPPPRCTAAMLMRRWIRTEFYIEAGPPAWLIATGRSALKRVLPDDRAQRDRWAVPCYRHISDIIRRAGMRVPIERMIGHPAIRRGELSLLAVYMGFVEFGALPCGKGSGGRESTPAWMTGQAAS